MKSIFDDISPKDLIAFLLIAGLILFKMTGHNGTFDLPVAVIVGYYFARREDTQITLPSEILANKPLMKGLAQEKKVSEARSENTPQ